jgi:hypothetical protein
MFSPSPRQKKREIRDLPVTVYFSTDAVERQCSKRRQHGVARPCNVQSRGRQAGTEEKERVDASRGQGAGDETCPGTSRDILNPIYRKNIFDPF